MAIPILVQIKSLCLKNIKKKTDGEWQMEVVTINLPNL